MSLTRDPETLARAVRSRVAAWTFMVRLGEAGSETVKRELPRTTLALADARVGLTAPGVDYVA